MTPPDALALRHAASRLAGEFDGTFGAQTIELLRSSDDQFPSPLLPVPVSRPRPV